MRILIVEDDLLLAEAINDFFTLKGWQTGKRMTEMRRSRWRNPVPGR